MVRESSVWLATVICIAALPSLACNEKAAERTHVRDDLIAARFPGAGRGGAALPLSSGPSAVLCDKPGPLPAGSTGPVPGATAHRDCYFDATHPDDPSAIMEWIVEAGPEGELVHARLTFNPRFVDNTYGDNAIGWDARAAMAPMNGKPMAPKPKPGKGGHTFKDLVGSDHAEFTLTDANGATKLKFKADYITESASAPSGYACLGVTGGEGKMLVGSATDVVAVSTSLDRDLNTCGYASYIEDSPATDASYSPNPSAPKWDFRVVYDVWVKRSAFADPGFGKASVEFVHASPSKAGSNTIEVTPGECPPTWPPYCGEAESCAPSDRCGDEPDESCTVWPPCDGGECKPSFDAGLPLF